MFQVRSLPLTSLVAAACQSVTVGLVIVATIQAAALGRAETRACQARRLGRSSGMGMPINVGEIDRASAAGCRRWCSDRRRGTRGLPSAASKNAHRFAECAGGCLAPLQIAARQPLGKLVRVNPDRADRRHQDHLDPAVPHLDQRLFRRAGAEQRRLWLQAFEIAADRHAFGDHRAVIQLQSRGLPARIERDEFWRLMLARRNRKILRGQAQSPFPRRRCAPGAGWVPDWAVEEQHLLPLELGFALLQEGHAAFHRIGAGPGDPLTFGFGQQHLRQGAVERGLDVGLHRANRTPSALRTGGWRAPCASSISAASSTAL